MSQLSLSTTNSNDPLHPNQVQQFLDESQSLDQQQMAELILKLVAKEFEVSVADLLGMSRKQTVAMARAISIYLLRSVLSLSFSNIGDLFGGRDHSTIMYAEKKIRNLLENEQPDNLARQKTRILESRLAERLLVNY